MTPPTKTKRGPVRGPPPSFFAADKWTEPTCAGNCVFAKSGPSRCGRLNPSRPRYRSRMGIGAVDAVAKTTERMVRCCNLPCSRIPAHRCTTLIRHSSSSRRGGRRNYFANLRVRKAHLLPYSFAFRTAKRSATRVSHVLPLATLPKCTSHVVLKGPLQSQNTLPSFISE